LTVRSVRADTRPILAYKFRYRFAKEFPGSGKFEWPNGEFGGLARTEHGGEEPQSPNTRDSALHSVRPIRPLEMAELEWNRQMRAMGKSMRAKKLPNTDSIQELAKFWDKHDLTDFAEALEEIGERVFARSKHTPLSVDLPPQDLQCVRRLAKSKGVKETTMVREWILERLHQSL